MILPTVLILFSALLPHVHSNTICGPGEIALGYSQRIANDQAASQFPSSSSQITIFSAECGILSRSDDIGQLDYCDIEISYSGGYGVVCGNNRGLAWITSADAKFASCYPFISSDPTAPLPNCDSQTDSYYLETSVLYCCGASEDDNTAPRRNSDGVYELKLNEDILPQSPNRPR